MNQSIIQIKANTSTTSILINQTTKKQVKSKSNQKTNQMKTNQINQSINQKNQWFNKAMKQWTIEPINHSNQSNQSNQPNQIKTNQINQSINEPVKL